MQILTCDIALGGDEQNVVTRGFDRPVTYPELLVLSKIHGSINVREVRCIAEQERDHEAERARLRITYGQALVDGMFGEWAPLPEADKRLKVVPVVVKRVEVEGGPGVAEAPGPVFPAGFDPTAEDPGVVALRQMGGGVFPPVMPATPADAAPQTEG